jgi:beta-glucosidase
MPQATFNFPKGFLWGTATASHQVEGRNTNNNWSAWEQRPGHIFEEQKAGLACDWWSGRWREDFDRAAECHQNAHRFSIEWSRVQPAPDRWDENALEVYRAMARGLIERGMTPMVTLHHFSEPIWLAEYGSWEGEEAITYFAAYARKVVEALSSYVSLWVTFNEPNTFSIGAYSGGGFPPGKNNLGVALKVMVNMARAHAAAYRAIHAAQPKAQVGISQYYRSLKPARPWLPLDSIPASLQSQIFNHAIPRTLIDGRFNGVFKRAHLPEAVHTLDFLGVNYYTRDMVSFSLRHAGQLFGKRTFPKGAEVSQTGFLANVPEGMFEALKWGAAFKVPLYVTENGVEDRDDRLRPRYTLAHIHQVWRAVNYNWPVRGYFHWTLVDNFEWERGWSQRFGLWELNEATQTRRKRPSAEMYGRVCGENAISSALVGAYAPELLPELFPG